jgi:hypothetical protein
MEESTASAQAAFRFPSDLPGDVQVLYSTNNLKEIGSIS